MNLVRCAVCGDRLRSLVPHLPTHGLTAKKYRLRFPGLPVISRATLRELGVHGKYLGILRHGRHRKQRSRWHPGELSARPWPMLCGAVEGRTLAEIAGASDVLRKTARVGDVLRGMGLMADGRHYVPTLYDLGRPVTADYVAPFLRATGLDRPWLADVFDLPHRVVNRILHGPDYRLAPHQAASIIQVRDRLLTSSRSIPSGGQGGGRGLLMILIPNLRDAVPLLQEVFARSRAFLMTQPEPRLEHWQDWVCEQASLEKVGRQDGDLFLRFLPFAPEISPFIGRHLDRLRGSCRIGLLVFDAMASRLGMRPSALLDVLWKRTAVRTASAFELQRLLLQKKDQGARSTAIYAEAADLYRQGNLGYGKLAKLFYPEDYTEDPDSAKKKMQRGVQRCLERTARYYRETSAASDRAAARETR